MTQMHPVGDDPPRLSILRSRSAPQTAHSPLDGALAVDTLQISASRREYRVRASNTGAAQACDTLERILQGLFSLRARTHQVTQSQAPAMNQVQLY